MNLSGLERNLSILLKHDFKIKANRQGFRDKEYKSKF